MKKIDADRIDYIRELYKAVSQIGARGLRERRLRGLCKRVAGVSDLRFLTTEGAAKILLELKARRHKKLEARACAKKILLRSLSRQEREILKKENPFRTERNKLLQILRSRGCSYPILSAVSGLGLTQLFNILRKRKLLKIVKIEKEGSQKK